jgi:ubiquinone/menaquinone biosynthesis C-methylase UbiE
MPACCLRLFHLCRNHVLFILILVSGTLPCFVCFSFHYEIEANLFHSFETIVTSSPHDAVLRITLLFNMQSQHQHQGKKDEGEYKRLEPSTHARGQYFSSTSNLEARIAIHQYSTNPEPWFSWLCARLLSPSSGAICFRDGHVLEVGAGTGELWNHVSPSLTRSLTLTDFSPAMCDRLQTREFLQGTLSESDCDDARERVEVKQCDAADLPFPNGIFDVVIANHMLYHVDDPDKVLAEFIRVLKPGGTVVISLNGANHMVELHELATRALGRSLSIIETTARMTADNAQELLKKRFDCVTAERFPGNIHVPLPEPVIAYLESLSGEPFTDEQGNKLRAMIGNRIAEDGYFTVQKDTVLFTARRRLIVEY